MRISFEFDNQHYRANLNEGLDISIPLQPGDDNPNCYYAEPVKFKTIEAGDFIGSVERGGPVNYQSVFVTPHGNGTHTECYGHIIADEGATLNQCLTDFHFVAQLITLPCVKSSNGDSVVDYDAFEKLFNQNCEALIIRTTPNGREKLEKQYSGTNPCYLDSRIAGRLSECGVKHLLIDLPSLDKEVDGGELKAHRAFWGMPDAIRKNCTITELIYVNDSISDGLYLLNLQITSLEIDASPSKPVLFKIEEY